MAKWWKVGGSAVAVCAALAAAPAALAFVDLSVAGCSPTDNCPSGGPGDGNSLVEPGEDGTLVVTVQNTGNETATGVFATVTTATPGVTITQPSTAFPDIPSPGFAPGDPPIAFTVDDTVPCGTDIVFEVAIFSDQGNFRDVCTISIPVNCTICSGTPDLSVAGCSAVDDCAFGGFGDGDGNVDPGESAQMTVSVQNTGGADATNVTAIVTTSTPGVFISQGNTSFGDVPAPSFVMGIPTIDFTVADTVPCGTLIVFDVLIQSDQGDVPDRCSIQIPVNCRLCATGPRLSVAGCASQDDCPFGGFGDGDGNVDPGESADMTVSVQNLGNSDATNVTAVVTSSTPGVTVTQGNTSFGDIPSFAFVMGIPAIQYTVAESVPCDSNLVFDVLIQSDQGDVNDVCNVQVVQFCRVCSSGPVMSVAGCAPQDSCPTGGPGDGDSFIDPGEDIELTLTVQNLGMQTATNVTADVTTTTPGVTITQGTTSFGDVPAPGFVMGIPTIDFRVGQNVPCGTDIVLDVLIRTDQGDTQDSCTVNIPVACTPCRPPGPDLSVSNCDHRDTCAVGAGNANGIPEPGETATLAVEITNLGNLDGTNVTATLSSTTPGVTITQPNSNYGTIPPAGSVIGVPAFGYTVSTAVACGTTLDFLVSITSDQGNFGGGCDISLTDPCLTCDPNTTPYLLTFQTSTLINDNCPTGGPGDGDGQAEPGEQIQIDVTVRNEGPSNGTGITGTLVALGPGITVTTPTVGFGAIAANTNRTTPTPFAFTIDSTVPCGTDLRFRIDFTSNEGTPPSDIVDDLRIPNPCDVCSGGPVPPGEVPFVITSCSGSALQICWRPATNATIYNVYEGTMAALRNAADPWDHGAVLCDQPLTLCPAQQVTIPGTTCGDGASFYYLVVGENAVGEGPYGRADENGDGIGDRPIDVGAPLCP